MTSQLDRARDEALAWIRAAAREPEFLASQTHAELAQADETIGHRFLHWIRESGFAFQIVEVGGPSPPAYEARWTYHGSEFVGFKQPRPEATTAGAVLAGCAALLDNEWCRSRLPA